METQSYLLLLCFTITCCWGSTHHSYNVSRTHEQNSFQFTTWLRAKQSWNCQERGTQQIIRVCSNTALSIFELRSTRIFVSFAGLLFTPMDARFTITRSQLKFCAREMVSSAAFRQDLLLYRQTRRDTCSCIGSTVGPQLASSPHRLLAARDRHLCLKFSMDSGFRIMNSKPWNP